MKIHQLQLYMQSNMLNAGEFFSTENDVLWLDHELGGNLHHKEVSQAVFLPLQLIWTEAGELLQSLREMEW